MYSWRTQANTKTLNYAKSADIERGEKEMPGTFLDRLREAVRECTDIDLESSEGGTILKNRFVTHLASDIFHKLLKQAFGPNQSLEKLLQLAQMVCYGRGYEEENSKKKKEPGKGLKPQQWLLDLLWNSLRTNVQRNPGEKGWTSYYCGNEGHLKRDCPQASKPSPGPCLQRTIPEKRLPHKCRPQGPGSQDNQDQSCRGVPTQASILITPKEPLVLITVGGQSVEFLLNTAATFSVLTEAPGPFSSWSTTVTGQSEEGNYFSHPLSCNWDSVLFSNHASISLTPSGEGYTEQGSGLCFHKYGTCSFNWTKHKS